MLLKGVWGQGVAGAWAKALGALALRMSSSLNGRCSLGRIGKQDWVSRSVPDGESHGSPREEFGFDLGSVGRQFRFWSKDMSWRKSSVEWLIWK